VSLVVPYVLTVIAIDILMIIVVGACLASDTFLYKYQPYDIGRMFELVNIRHDPCTLIMVAYDEEIFPGHCTKIKWKCYSSTCLLQFDLLCVYLIRTCLHCSGCGMFINVLA